ncbi:hypothetical protein [Massilia sp. GCM10023247]|uniref:hypothetical protein n=1 Tax=Massilia sp. GCM10023247 TaxID=3252643 RepID=UPI003611D353
MRELSIDEIREVSGASAKQVVTVGLTSGGAALGSYFAAARLGGALGAAAGPVGALGGALIGVSIAIVYHKYV